MVRDCLGRARGRRGARGREPGDDRARRAHPRRGRAPRRRRRPLPDRPSGPSRATSRRTRSRRRWRRPTSSCCPTVQSLSHTAARRGRDRGRGAGSRRCRASTEEMLARVMSADIEGLRRKGEAIAAALTAGSEARITCANGSDLRLGLGEREAIADAGDLTAPGAFGNLPCGEGFIAPIEGTAEGTLVVDGTIASIGRRRGAGRAHGRGRPPGRGDRRRRARGCSTCCAPTAASRAPTSPSSGSAPTRRPS